MPDLRVDLDITGYVQEVEAARNRDIPFVTAKALTRTAQDGQIEMRRNVGQKFQLRNSWTQQNIRIKPAQKLSWPIQSEVYTDTGNGKAPDYLTGQEDGAEKVAHNGHSHIAIPTHYLRNLVGAGKVIPPALRPAELLSAFTGTHVNRGKKAVRTSRAQQFVGFKQYLNGELYIFGRRPDSPRSAIPLYVLVPEARVKAVLGMEATVERVANDRFEQHWDDAWAEIANP